MIDSVRGVFVIDLCTVALCTLIALRCASSFLQPALHRSAVRRTGSKIIMA
jgi:hypothetical protein